MRALYTQTCRKLVDGDAEFGLALDHTYMVRAALVVDKKRPRVGGGEAAKLAVRWRGRGSTRHGGGGGGGDVQKVDQFDGSNYANVDTLFSLGETYLFCQLVELDEALRVNW